MNRYRRGLAGRCRDRLQGSPARIRCCPPEAPPLRRSVVIRTAFRGPGAREGSRRSPGRCDDRFAVDRTCCAPIWAGCARTSSSPQHRRSGRGGLREGFVTDEFSIWPAQTAPAEPETHLGLCWPLPSAQQPATDVFDAIRRDLAHQWSAGPRFGESQVTDESRRNLHVVINGGPRMQSRVSSKASRARSRTSQARSPDAMTCIATVRPSRTRPRRSAMPHRRMPKLIRARATAKTAETSAD